MIFFAIRWFVLTLAIMLASYMLQGIVVQDFFTALFAAAMLGLLNTFFRPILIVLTLPINVVSLGLFTFVINAVLLLMVSGVISGFEIRGFWTAVLGSLIISATNWLLSSLISDRIRIQRHSGGSHDGYIDMKKRDDDRWE